MKVKSVIKKGRNYKVSFENNSTLLLDQDLVAKYNLYTDLEISPETYSAIQEDSEYRKTYSSALRILSRRSHSEHELKIKLKQKNFSVNSIDKVIEKLLELDYLNDKKFSGEYFDFAADRKKMGPIKIKYELRRKGISDEIVNELFGRDLQDIFLENSLLLAQKKLAAIDIGKLEKEQIRNKLFSFLQQKGYETDTIYQTLKSMKY